MDDKTRNAIGLKKFSIIGPVLNGQVSSNTEYFRQVADKAIDMPYYGMRNYTVKTLETWLYLYHKYGLDGLIRNYRSDKGKHRKISDELGVEIISRRKVQPNVPITMLYGDLVKDGLIDPSDISMPTLYRYIEDLSISGELVEDNKKGESLRFSYEHVGDLWQGDVLYGPHIMVGRKKVRSEDVV